MSRTNRGLRLGGASHRDPSGSPPVCRLTRSVRRRSKRRPRRAGMPRAREADLRMLDESAGGRAPLGVGARERGRVSRALRQRADCNWRARREPAARARCRSSRSAHPHPRLCPTVASLSDRPPASVASLAVVSPARDSDASSLSVSASASGRAARIDARKEELAEGGGRRRRLVRRARQDRTKRVTHGALVGQRDEVKRARRIDDLAGTDAEAVPPPQDATKGSEVSGKAVEQVHLVRTRAVVAHQFQLSVASSKKALAEMDDADYLNW